MSRPVESITINYKDEKGEPAELNCPVSEGIDVGTAVNRLTNGKVSQGTHVITQNGAQVPDNAPCADGDRLVASPRKTGGGA